MIERLHDTYRCVSTVYRGDRLYKPGQIMLLPAGTEYKGKAFVLEKEAQVIVEVGAVESPRQPKKKKEKAPEVEG